MSILVIRYSISAPIFMYDVISHFSPPPITIDIWLGQQMKVLGNKYDKISRNKNFRRISIQNHRNRGLD